MVTTVKWSAFTAGSAISGTDNTVGLQGGVNVLWTWSQAQTYVIALSSSQALSWNGDTFLVRDGASNTAALRNGGTSAAAVGQVLNIYEYWASANDYSRISIGWDQSNTRFQLVQQKAGSASARQFFFQAGSNSGFVLSQSSSNILSLGQDGVGSYWTLTQNTGQLLGIMPNGGVGYGTGAGGTVTQATSRTTGVTLNKICGAITLVSAAGTATWQTFTLTNSSIAATDVVIVNQKSGTDLNMISVTNVSAGSCKISFATTGGTTTEQPVFSFAVIKGVTA